jgi:hypothetical protein
LLAASGTNQQIGNIIVNHAEKIAGKTNLLTGEQVHAMYAIFGIADDTQTALEAQAPGATYNGLDSIYVGKSVDGGVTWTDSLVYKVDPKTKRELNMLFPVITSDASGNLYAAWSDTYKIQYSVSTDHGAHWSKPYQVNRNNRGVNSDGSDKPDAGQADVFPWIAAGKGGLLDVVWYHGQGGTPVSNRIYRDPGDAKTAWTVAFAQLGTANHQSHGTASPSVLTYNQAITPVIHYGDICQNGTFCSLVPVSGAPLSTGDRSLLDFFQVAVDGDGRANLAIADNATAPGQSISAYMIQLTGYSLTTGKKLPTLRIETPTTKCKADATFTDPSGDANEVLVATPLPSQPALDVTRSYLNWDASGKKVSFHVVVKDASQDPPAGATGEEFDYAFGIDGKGYIFRGTHDVTGDSADLESPLQTTVSDSVTFTVDKAHNEFVFTIPADALNKISDPAKRARVLGPGAKLTGFTVTARRSEGAHFLPNADEAAGLCPFVIPAKGSVAAAALPSNPGANDPGLLPAAPSVNALRSAVRTALPVSILLGLAVGAAAAAAVGGRGRHGLVLAS